MKLIETASEHGRQIDTSKLEYHGRREKIYADGRSVMVRACNDIFMGYDNGKENGILMVTRDAHPAKGYLWCLGGGIKRGVALEESVRRKVLEECGLQIRNIDLMGVGRMMWETDPDNTGKGIDDLGLAFYADAEGEINLDKLHRDPVIVTPSKFENMKRSGDPKLHPYIEQFLGEALQRRFS